ncbi:uncharacterized protein EKO05_0001592 [Ascochyta rabiei]|uniref:uncharacterized protein n=1 Tax=Didymella rabiei TaxID=5454 RepID=UPI0022091541|nr:uncharacterized protein EKO05_0001592 [Ascochyta rabiei]UPX10962.1 hypothetical protein EKO05_0001592 [Ascochyta rabiei]
MEQEDKRGQAIRRQQGLLQLWQTRPLCQGLPDEQGQLLEDPESGLEDDDDCIVPPIRVATPYQDAQTGKETEYYSNNDQRYHAVEFTPELQELVHRFCKEIDDGKQFTNDLEEAEDQL